MFTRKIAIQSLTLPILAGIAAIFMVSCATQQRTYNQSDGIYSPGVRSYEDRAPEAETSDRSSYYKQYFESKANVYSDIPEENLIFTDIDAYSTKESMDEHGNIIIEENYYEEGYGPWGSNPEGVSVNIYNYGGYYGYGYGFWNRPYYYGFYYPWHFSYYGGYYGPYWGIGWGYGWGGYYGWGYPYYYPSYYYGGYYGHYPGNYVSYNRGRRNTDYRRSAAPVRGRSSSAVTREGTYSRSEATRRINRNNVSASGRTQTGRTQVQTSRNTTRATTPGVIRNPRSTNTGRSTDRNIQRSTDRNIQRSSPGTIRNQTRTSPSRSTIQTPRSSQPGRSSIRSGGSQIRSGSGIRSGGGGGRSSGAVRGRR